MFSVSIDCVSWTLILSISLTLFAFHQGALVLIVDYLNSERLTANHLLTASLVPALASLISQGPSETAMLALEALNALTHALEDMAVSEHQDFCSIHTDFDYSSSLAVGSVLNQA